MDSTFSNSKMRRKAEAATTIEMLRKRTRRNVPLALFYLSVPLFIIFGTDAIRLIHIGQHDFIDVAGLIALALCFIYAAIMAMFVRTSDKVLLLLAEEIFKDDSEARVPTMLNKANASDTKKQEVEKDAANNGDKLPS